MLDPWSLRQSKWKKRLYMLWRLRRNLNRAAAIHFTTQIERDLAVPLKLKPPAVVETLGLDLKEFENLPPKGTFRAKYPQLGGRPIVLFLGRLHPGKGAEYLIPAFTHIVSPRRHRGTEAAADAVVVIAGPDSEGYRAKLEALVAGHGIGEQVVFTGPLYGRDRLAALVDADIFCLPSEHENFGIVVIEALACGTPVLISDQVNIHREITAAGVGGVVRVDVGDVAGGLRRWLTDANLRQSAAERAKVIVRERYDWTAVAGRWRAHYT
jgi:glycosyltransferase involved in cell wall biosynthesis